MLHEKFAEQDLTGETIRKCHSFYAAAAEDAGIDLPPQLKANTRQRGPRKIRRKSNKATPGTPPEDEFTPDGDPNGGDDKDPIQISSLLLDKEGKRSVKLKAPATVTKSELERIKNWLSFQLIVED
jgi:hypothetical protein